MAQSLIDFEWAKPRSPQSYRVVERKLTRPVHYHQPKLQSAPDLPMFPGQWGFAYVPLGIMVLPGPEGKAHKALYVVGADDDLTPYRPLEAYGSLFIEFAKLETPDDVLRFIQRYGALTEMGQRNRPGELVEGVLAHAAAMRRLLLFEETGRENKANLVDMQVNPFSELRVTLAFDPTTGALTERFIPSSLLDALWLQAVQKLRGGAVVRQCRHCGQPFEAGAGTGRRLDAVFCSEAHKIAFHSLKRSREE